MTFGMDAPCAAAELFSWVDDLDRYPEWLGIVERVEAVDPSPDGRPDGAEGVPAWAVELRGRVGPFARSKRLRMARTAFMAPSHVVFEREETDGRMHSAWVLEADVAPTASGSTLSMRLHYGGSLWGPILERLLADEVDRSRDRLQALVSAPRP